MLLTFPFARQNLLAFQKLNSFSARVKNFMPKEILEMPIETALGKFWNGQARNPSKDSHKADF
jgi:hypothetical protein